MSEDMVHQRVYKIFLSCKDDLKICDEHIEKLLKDHVRRAKNVDIDIKCIKKRENVKSAMQDMEDANENCVYVIDIQRDFDNTAYWQLGYAMGKKIKIIGYYAGKKNDKKISEDVDQLTMPLHSENSTHFLELISSQ
uniref:Uncharacterized protein n=1 Tax=Candidatus Methanogaster sp. ANME-2c ERB4 TaxID=2759911 RepID=A0A7G9YIP6_9EURY|nr:hypothetical protein LLFONJKP_00001 [Methanosarcinales archaeon ANME-2c ERB4]